MLLALIFLLNVVDFKDFFNYIFFVPFISKIINYSIVIGILKEI